MSEARQAVRAFITAALDDDMPAAVDIVRGIDELETAYEALMALGELLNLALVDTSEATGRTTEEVWRRLAMASALHDDQADR